FLFSLSLHDALPISNLLVQIQTEASSFVSRAGYEALLIKIGNAAVQAGIFCSTAHTHGVAIDPGVPQYKVFPVDKLSTLKHVQLEVCEDGAVIQVICATTERCALRFPPQLRKFFGTIEVEILGQLGYGCVSMVGYIHSSFFSSPGGDKNDTIGRAS